MPASKVQSTPHRSDCGQIKPFGARVKGLSHSGDKRYAVEGQVQTENVEDLAFHITLSGMPLLPQALRKLNHLQRQVRLLATSALGRFQLQVQMRDAITPFSVRAGERVGVDFSKQPQIRSCLRNTLNRFPAVYWYGAKPSRKNRRWPVRRSVSPDR